MVSRDKEVKKDISGIIPWHSDTRIRILTPNLPVEPCPPGLLEKYDQDYSNDPAYVAEGLAIKVTEEMLACLEQRNLNQSWLAERMGVSRARVSRILNAQPNMTLLTIAKIAIALGVKPDVCMDTEPWRMVWAKPVSSVSVEVVVPKPNRTLAAGELVFDNLPLLAPVTA